jgi:hypothetical protein
MSVLMSVLVWLPTSVVGGILGATVTAVLGSHSTTAVMANQGINSVVSAVAQAIFGAIPWIAATLMYYELRVRKEAFDLEQQASPYP